ncbi:trehalose-phosphatase, partial [Candidatus Saccharibacteria bacterium]|nr:trehalose-phosphatase [Candidatus Saccharibacteria bacterium]
TTRTTAMQRYLRGHTIDKWADNFMRSLELPIAKPNLRITRNMGSKQIVELRADYREARKRLILLDYDGTLQPIVQNPEDARPNRRTINILAELSKDERNHVVVISGRGRQDLIGWLGNLPITLVAEHGGFIRLQGHTKWKRTSQDNLHWEQKVRKILEYYTELTPGSFIEQKEWSLAWHYRDASPYYAQKHLVLLKKLLRPIARTEKLEIRENKKVLELHHLDISKGHITQEWLLSDEDFILAIGDDNTDEDMFNALPTYAYTTKVGWGSTTAHYRVKNVTAVHDLLRKL